MLWVVNCLVSYYVLSLTIHIYMRFGTIPSKWYSCFDWVDFQYPTHSKIPLVFNQMKWRKLYLAAALHKVWRKRVLLLLLLLLVGSPQKVHEIHKSRQKVHESSTTFRLEAPDDRYPAWFFLWKLWPTAVIWSLCWPSFMFPDQKDNKLKTVSQHSPV